MAQADVGDLKQVVPMDRVRGEGSIDQHRSTKEGIVDERVLFNWSLALPYETKGRFVGRFIVSVGAS